jgi:hypothetical protein
MMNVARTANDRPLPLELGTGATEEVQALLRGALAAAVDPDDAAALAEGLHATERPIAVAVLALDARAPDSPFVAAVLRAVCDAASRTSFLVVRPGLSLATMLAGSVDAPRAPVRNGLVRLRPAPAQAVPVTGRPEPVPDAPALVGSGENGGLSLRARRKAADLAVVRAALEETSGCVTAAAKLLGLTRKGLQERMIALGMRERQAPCVQLPERYRRATTTETADSPGGPR